MKPATSHARSAHLKSRATLRSAQEIWSLLMEEDPKVYRAQIWQMQWCTLFAATAKEPSQEKEPAAEVNEGAIHAASCSVPHRKALTAC